MTDQTTPVAARKAAASAISDPLPAPNRRAPAKKVTAKDPKRVQSSVQGNGSGGAGSTQTPKTSRIARRKENRVRRPAETTAGVAAVVTVLVSVLGLEGPQAKEVTAALTVVVGAIPILVSKFVDWKRVIDERADERLDLMERGIEALESLSKMNGNGHIVDLARDSLGLEEAEEESLTAD